MKGPKNLLMSGALHARCRLELIGPDSYPVSAGKAARVGLLCHSPGAREAGMFDRQHCDSIDAQSGSTDDGEDSGNTRRFASLA